MLFYIFNGRKDEIFGPICYSAIISLVLNIPFQVQEWNEFRIKQIAELIKTSKGKDRLLMQANILEFLLKNLRVFNPEARKELFNDLAILITDKRLIPELAESSNLVDIVFELNSFSEGDITLSLLQEELLSYMLCQSRHAAEFARVCSTLRGKSEYQIHLLNKILEKSTNSTDIFDPNFWSGLQYISYAFEDALLTNPDTLKNAEAITMLSKLLLILNKTDLLYISLPKIQLMDERVNECSKNLVDKDILSKQLL